MTTRARASAEAARAARERYEGSGQGDSDRERLLACFREHGPMTADTAAKKVGGIVAVDARKRVKDLKRLGLLEPTGEFGLSERGNRQHECRYVEDPMTKAVDDGGGKSNPPVKYAYDVERYRVGRKDWVVVATMYSPKGAQNVQARYAAMGSAVRVQKRLRHPDETKSEPLQQGELF